jgi:chemotaxis protein methyltransferase CheR
MIKITPSEFNFFAMLIYNLTGIVLDQTTKSYLVETRLSALLQEYNCASYNELYFKTKSDRSGIITNKIIDAMTTKETLFFRDSSPFEFLQHRILPDIIDQKLGKGINPCNQGVRIWSAACSTGQEVYSIAIIIKELLPDLVKYNIKIIGTDISNEAISRASYGQYNKFEIERGLSSEKLNKYFTKINSTSWKVKDEIRSMATFKRINLLEPFTGLGKFDIIFCRNVAIYFSQEDKIKLFNKIANILEQDGYLIIGSTESLLGISTLFEPKKYLRAVGYQLKK